MSTDTPNRLRLPSGDAAWLNVASVVVYVYGCASVGKTMALPRVAQFDATPTAVADAPPCKRRLEGGAS